MSAPPFLGPQQSNLSNSRDPKILERQGVFGKVDGGLFHIVVTKVAVFDNPTPVGYQFASDRIGPKQNAPVFEATSSRFVARRTPLHLFEKSLLALRKEELKRVKEDEEFEKRLKAAEAVIEMAGLLLAPEFALGNLELVESIITISEFFVIGAKLANGEQHAWCELAQTGTLEYLKSKGIKKMLPLWARICLDLDSYIKVGADGLKAQCHGQMAQETGTGKPARVRVPADDILDQCYRYRCIAQPGYLEEVRKREDFFEGLSNRGFGGPMNPAGNKTATIQQAPPFWRSN